MFNVRDNRSPVNPPPPGEYSPLALRAAAFAAQFAAAALARAGRGKCPTCGRDLWCHHDFAEGTDTYYCPHCTRWEPAA